MSKDGSYPFIVIMYLNYCSFSETMSQVFLFQTLLTEFGLLSPNHWFEHSQFRNLLTMTVLAYLKI